ncbi:ABC transporter permease subunit [Aquimarina algicola]|uniref:ABC transporter permease subunit n=1 Tax=Aquimarina algicola TaxID=2589995 RepID=A0A504JL06_9FLAO|nr:ABC transporter permease subunit [Aquimarina algicola]TPN87241.1 ABC transporter permease subunit [Aquimarina algicola]
MKQTRQIAILYKVIFVCLTVVPVMAGLIYALLYSFGIIGIMNNGFTGKYWIAVLLSDMFWVSLGYSLYIALVSITISLVFALSISLFIKKRNITISYLFYIPLCFPAVVMAFYSFQLWSKSGWISRIIYQIGGIKEISSFPDLTNDTLGFSIVFTSVLMIVPFFTILFSNLYHSEKLHELKKVAQNLGASSFQILIKITIPVLLKRSWFTICLFIIFVMSSYEIPLLLGKQNPQMISVLTMQKLQRFNLNDIPQAYTIASLYVMITIFVLTLLSIGGIKKRFITKRRAYA